MWKEASLVPLKCIYVERQKKHAQKPSANIVGLWVEICDRDVPKRGEEF